LKEKKMFDGPHGAILRPIATILSLAIVLAAAVLQPPYFVAVICLFAGLSLLWAVQDIR